MVIQWNWTGTGKWRRNSWVVSSCLCDTLYCAATIWAACCCNISMRPTDTLPQYKVPAVTCQKRSCAG